MAKASLSPRRRPVADAARPAGPDLNPRVERLRVERIAMAMAVREAGSSMSRPFHTQMRRPDFGDMDVGSGLRFRTRLRSSTVGIGCRLNRKWRKMRDRPERFRRQ